VFLDVKWWPLGQTQALCYEIRIRGVERSKVEKEICESVPHGGRCQRCARLNVLGGAEQDSNTSSTSSCFGQMRNAMKARSSRGLDRDVGKVDRKMLTKFRAHR
jgi:hypothetical protein